MGYIFVKDFVLKIWKKQIDKSDVTIYDSKTKLQEYSLKKFKELPIYKVVNTSGPKHNPLYKILVTIKGSKNFFGEGNSKQQAQQNAAKNLLKTLYFK